MKMNKIHLRIVSLLLCLTMIFGMAPAIQLFTAAEATSTIQEESSSTHSTHKESDGWQSINNTTANVASLFAAGGKFVLNGDIELVGVTVANDLHICLNGHTIYGTGDGNMFTVDNTSKAVTFTICDCGENLEGAVNASRKTTGDTIVSVRNNATFNLCSGMLTGKVGSAGGPAVRVEKATAVFNMTGGKITGNSYTSTGTAAGAKSVYITAGAIFNMSGGEITGNTSPNKEGIPSIFVRNGGTVYLSKAAKFDDGGIGQIGSPVATIQVKDLASEARIVSTTQLPWDSNDKTVKETVENNTYVYTYKAPISDPEARVGNQDYKTLAEALAAVTSEGTVTLLKDVSLDGLTEIVNGVNLTLDLNGNKILATGTGNVFTLSGTEDAPVTLTVKDSVGGGGIDASGKESGDTIISALDYATFNLYGGKLTGKQSSVGGAAVRVVREPAAFNMYGGMISGNSTTATNATAAHSVFVKDGATFTMYGGEISGNTPDGNTKPSVCNYNNTGAVVFTGAAVFDDGAVSGTAVVKELTDGAHITATNALTLVSGDNTVKVSQNGNTYTYEAYRIANWNFFADNFEHYTAGKNAFQVAVSTSTGAAYPYWQIEDVARPDYLPFDICEDGENQFLKMTTVNSASARLITKYGINGGYTLRMDFRFDSATTDYNVLAVTLAGDNTILSSDGKTMQQKLNVQFGSGSNGIWWPHIANKRILNADGTRMTLADDTWYTMEYTLELGKMTVSVWPAGNESAKRTEEWVSSEISEEVLSQANTARIQVTGKEGNTRVVCLDNIYLSKTAGLDVEDSVTVQAGNVLSSTSNETTNQQPVPQYSYEPENPELGYTNHHGQFVAGYKDAKDTSASVGKTKLTVTLLDLRGNKTDITYQTELNVTAPSGGNTGGGLKVLAIGNTFTSDTLEYVSQLAAKANAKIDLSYLIWGTNNGLDGKLQHHAYNLANNVSGYKWYVSDPSTGKMTLVSSNATISEKVESQQWDVIILQQQATSAGVRGTFSSDLQYLVDYLEQEQPNAKLYWNMTWALKNASGGSGTVGYDFKTYYDSNTNVMYNAVVEMLDEFIVGENALFSSTNPNNLGTGIGWGFDGCLFTGTAIQNVRAKREPTQSGGYNLTVNIGRLTAGMAAVKTLYDEFGLGGSGVKLDLSQTFTWNTVKGMLSSGIFMDYYYAERYISDIQTAANAAATVEGLPAKLTVTAQTKPENADDQADSSIQVEAPQKLHFPDVKTLDNGIMVSIAYESVSHTPTGTSGDPYKALSGGAGRLVLFESRDNGKSWNGANPVLVIDELQLHKWNIANIYDRHASIGAGKSYIALADARDPNLATTYVDFDNDGEQEQVVIVTFWIVYYDAEGKSAAKTNLWMLTGVRNDDGSYTWAAPKAVSGATQKRGDIASFSDGEILLPGYTQNVVRMVWNAVQQTWIEKYVYAIPNLAPDEAGSNTFSEVSLVAPDPDGDTVFAFCRDNGTVLKSADRGATWELIANEEGLIDQPGFAVIDKNTVFVTWARTAERPRKTYGKIFYVHADWNDTEAVLIYDSEETDEHDAGDPSCAINADGDAVVVSYDVAYRSIVFSIVDLDNEKWAAPKFTVTFDNGVTQTVAYGDKVTKPADPIKDGYAFAGWYNGETKWNFDDAVVGDLALTAAWTVEHKVVIDKAAAPTCTKTGLTEGSHCEICGEVFVKQEVVPTKDHEYRSDCHDFCDVCGTTREPLAEHSFFYCELMDGTHSYFCDICGYGTEETLVEECKDGNDDHKCDHCGYAVTDHQWSNWTETVTPDCETEGEETRTCSICGKTEIQAVPAAGHSWDEGVVTDPTTESDGYTTYTCTVCGTEKVDYNEGSRLPELNVFGEKVTHSLLYKDKIQIQTHYVIDETGVNITYRGALIWEVSEYEAELDAFLTAKANKVQYTGNEVYDVELFEQGGKYLAKNVGLKPRELHLEFYTVPYVVIDGEYVYGEPDRYSVWQYADDILTKSQKENSKRSVETMLRFAKYAQLYLAAENGVEAYVENFDAVLQKHNLSTDVAWTDADNALVVDQLEVIQPEYSTNFTQWGGSSLLMKDQTGLGFTLKGKFADNIEVLYWDANAYAAANGSPVKGTETGTLEIISYTSDREQAMATGISVRQSAVKQFYVRMYNTQTGELSQVKADSITALLARMVDKYEDDPDKAVSLSFARAYLKFIDAVAVDLGTD